MFSFCFSTIPPPAHHSSSRAGPVLSGSHHPHMGGGVGSLTTHHSHPLPAHLQPAAHAVFQAAHPSQVAAAVAPYAYASLNSTGKAQYQHFWFAE